MLEKWFLGEEYIALLLMLIGIFLGIWRTMISRGEGSSKGKRFFTLLSEAWVWGFAFGVWGYPLGEVFPERRCSFFNSFRGQLV